MSSRRMRILILIVLFCVLVSSVPGCAVKEYISSVSFSPDGKKIILDRHLEWEMSSIQVYDLETGKLNAYQPPPNERWAMMRYSRDGKRVVFITSPIKDGKTDPKGTQLAVMSPDGSNYRKISNSPGLKIYPSFSNSGKKIIYARTPEIWMVGRTAFGGYDVHEIDIETGQEKRLTEFEFRHISRPNFYPDDRTFIFSGEYPTSFPDLASRPDLRRGKDLEWGREVTKRQRELLNENDDNNIYLMHGGEQALVDPFFKFYYRSSYPDLSGDGSRLFFCGDAEPEAELARWGVKVYLYSPDGKHRRIIGRDVQMINYGYGVSHDGKMVGIAAHEESNRDRLKIVIYNVQEMTKQEIKLPWRPDHIINE